MRCHMKRQDEMPDKRLDFDSGYDLSLNHDEGMLPPGSVIAETESLANSAQESAPYLTEHACKQVLEKITGFPSASSHFLGRTHKVQENKRVPKDDSCESFASLDVSAASDDTGVVLSATNGRFDFHEAECHG